MITLKELIKAYEKWVTANPSTVCDVETTVKWLSYIIAGHMSNSLIVSEMVHALSNIMVLYHDRIIQVNQTNKKLNINLNISQGYCYRLKFILTTLEYCEVFIEISAKRLFGNKGKWFLITMVQLVKALGRYYILQHSNEQIIAYPILPSLNRRTLLKESKTLAGDASLSKNVLYSNGYTKQEHKIVFQLQRSGRIIRRVEGAPPMQYRTFNLIDEAEVTTQSQIPNQLLKAEYSYILKPLVHLFAMKIFGEKTWKPYLISLAMDFYSIKVYNQHYHLLTKHQRLILSHRCVNLLSYLMRSPFYELFTQSHLDNMLSFVATNIPVIKILAEPLKKYVPHYQSMYFYLWST